MKKILGFALVMGTILSSCNMPSSGAPDPQIATAAALTVQAAIDSSPNTQKPPASPTPRSTGAITETPTYSKPMVSVGDVTNCRTGPSVNYERVTQLLPETPVEIIGFFPPNYWIVSTSAGNCWVSGEFVTPAGSFTTVPTVTAPPTSTTNSEAPEPAAFPQNGWTFFCYNSGQADITISWIDKATNETGYRILRNDEVVAELPANTTYFEETITLLSGQSVGYQIQGYNTAGQTNSAVATIACP